MWCSPITSIDNFKYYLVLVDHYTKYTWIYPLRQKSQVKEVLIAYKSLIEKKFNLSIRTLFSDNGGEYVALRGISHLTSPPHTPQHNGVSERKHRHIVETSLTLLSTASMPKTFWTYAFTAAVYLINRLPSPTISMQSPYYKLFGDKPNYEKLKVFGCLCFPWLRPYNTNKLQDCSKRCAFLGYSPTQSAYYCIDIETSRIYTYRHVQFNETEFPFITETQKQTPTPTASTSMEPPISFIPISRMGSPGMNFHSKPRVLPSESLNSLTSSTSETIAHSQNESTPMTASPNLQ